MSKSYLLINSLPDYYGAIEQYTGTSPLALPVENLLKNSPGLVARSADVNGFGWSSTWPTTHDVDTIVIWNHSQVAGGTWTYHLRNGGSSGSIQKTDILSHDDDGGTEYHTGWLRSDILGYSDNHSVVTLPQTYTCDYVSVTQGGTDGGEYLDVGRFMVGKRWEASVGLDFGYDYGSFDPSEIAEFEDKSIATVQARDSYKIGQLRWHHTSRQEAQDLVNALHIVGKKRSVFLNVYPDEHSDLARPQRLLIRLTDWTGVIAKRNAYPAAFTVEMAFREET